ncbi:MAG: hypothetical protein ABWX67_17280 [Allosphingosinicella sp.]
MNRLDRMSGLRGGAVYRAANVTPTTVQSWPIEIGTKVGEGHKRYNFGDVISLSLMRELVFTIGVKASHAAAVVNGLRDRVGEEVAVLLAEQAERGSWRWDGGPYAVVQHSRRGRGDDWLHIFDDKQLAEFGSDQSSGFIITVIPLPRLINASQLALENALGAGGAFVSEESEQ